MKIEEFDDRHYDNNSLLIVYGTSIFGEITHYCLKQRKIVPDYYVSQEGQGVFHGVPVISLDKLAKIYHNNSAIILLAVGNASRDIILNLKKFNIDMVYSVGNLIDEIRDMKDMLSPEYKSRFIYQHQLMSFINNDKLIMYSLDVVVTEKCSLKCKSCSNLMQYYSNPRNIDIYEIKQSLDKLLKYVDFIYEMRLLGGEPFMNPEFYKLVDWYRDNNKVKKIVIYTNGTIFPSEEIRHKLVDSKIILRISNYGKLSSKLKEWSQWCEYNDVDYEVLEVPEWHDLGRLEKHRYSLNEIVFIYNTCDCHDVPTLINNRLYNCPYAANAINLGALYDDEAELDFLDVNNEKITKIMIKKFLFERQYLMACDYCGGRSFLRSKAQPYEQTGESLEYIKRVGRSSDDEISISHNSCI